MRHGQTGSRAANGHDRAVSQKRASRIRRWLLSTALAGAAFVPDALHAETWNGSADTDFANGANWDGGGAPLTGGVVTISGGANAPVVSTDAGKFYTFDLTNLTLGIAPAATLSTYYFTGGAASTVSGGGTLAADTLTLNGGVISTTVVSPGLITLNSGTISGNISGTASVIKDSAGSGTLSGTNTYIGGTTIMAGTLSFSSGAIPGDIGFYGNGALRSTDSQVFNHTMTIGGGVSPTISAATGATFQIGSGFGTGLIAHGGSGTTVRFGTASDTGTVVLDNLINVYGGGAISIDGGTLRGNNNSQLVLFLLNSVSLDIAASATLDIYASQGGAKALRGAGTITTSLAGVPATLFVSGGIFSPAQTTFSGVIQDGASPLSLSIDGHDLTLTGANTYSGTTKIYNAGTLRVGNGGTGGTLGTGAVVLGGVGDTGTLVFNRSDNLAVANNISGFGALQKLGGGTLTMSGTQTFTGTTTVDAGKLIVNGSSSSLVTVNAGATLGGNGSVGATTVNGGTLAPGNSIGTLTVNGNLSFTAASSYMVEVSPANADRTNVTGTATLGGATVNAGFAPGSYIARQYTILNATGVVSGTFGAQVNTSLPSNFTSNLSYDTHNAYLNLVLNFVPPPSGGLGTNQQNVANAIVGFFNSTGGVPLVFGGLTSAGLGQISGETATGMQQTTFNAMTQFMGVMTDPFLDGRGGTSTASGASHYTEAGSGRGAGRDAYAMITKAGAPIPFTQRWSVWAAGYGGSQTTNGNATLGSNTATSRIYGTAVGADYRISANTLAGFALAGGGTNFNLNGFGNGRSDLFQAGAFVRHTVGATYFSGALAYGWQDVTTDRTVTVAGIDRLRAQFNANAWSGRAEGGYRFATPLIGLTPYAAGQFTTFELPAYAETVVSGANTFALAYGAKTVTASRSELGLRTDKSFAMNDAVLTLRGRAAWAHDFNPDRSINATFQTLPGAGFTVNGAAQSADKALTTASAEVKWMSGFSLAATFEGEFAGNVNSYAGKGVARYIW